MFPRKMSEELKLAAQQYPVVTLTGPRQSGKTTLVKETFPDKPYANLESLRTREFAQTDPLGFLESFPDGAILDEIQRCPELLSEIQVRVDLSDKKGLFILTGSHQFGLRGAIAQSLAGRTAILHLLPIMLSELKNSGKQLSLNEALYYGGYPRIHKENLNPSKAYSHYVQTYLERDLRQMIEIKNLDLFQKFLKLCAGHIGQIFNKENLAAEVGVSAKTIGQWVSLLEASYLVFLLPPYFESFGKRVIKSSKLYFYDVGLASFLLSIEKAPQLDRDPLRGNLIENMVILELLKSRWNQGLEHRLYYYRDSGQNEVDVVFQQADSLLPIEIKSAQTFNHSFLKGLSYFQKLLRDRCLDPVLVYSGDEEIKINGVQLLNFHHAERALENKS